ncbi:hypothetical protein ONZ45_g6539 [Pleurotus djamor]|nr:hypothetical protein ONZ45_g6539 [Pleurotus djamor]
MSSNTRMQVAAVVSFYMCAALVMVFVNKAVLNNAPDLPLLFLLFQLLIAVVLLHASALVTKRIDLPKLEVETAKKLVPVVAVNIIGLVFNTLCLRDVEASFFQIARGLNLPLTILISSLVTKSTPSQRIIGTAAIVTLGFLLGVTPSSSLPTTATPSLLSLFYGVCSSLFIAIHAVLIKTSLPYCNNSAIQLAYWTNLGSAVMVLPFVFFHGETIILQNLLSDSKWNPNVFLWGTLVTGVFGFLLCVAGLLSIKVTSPVTHMFSSAARSVLQTLLGVWIFSDVLTVNRATSIMVILAGTMLFTWVKHKETASAPPRRPADIESGPSTAAKGDESVDTTIWKAPEKLDEDEK